MLPVLILLVLGMLEFSRAYNAQLSLSGAAREGARVMAIHDDADLAIDLAQAAAPTVSFGAGDVTVAPSSCSSGAQIEFRIDYSLPLMTGMFGLSLPITGIGVMQCGG